MIDEFPARQWKWHMLTNNWVFWVLASPIGSMVAINVVRSELVQTWSRLITKLQPRRTTKSLILVVEMFSVNFLTFAFCKLSSVTSHDSLENVAGIDAFKVEYLRDIHNFPFFMLPVHFWAFWWKPVASLGGGGGAPPQVTPSRGWHLNEKIYKE